MNIIHVFEALKTYLKRDEKHFHKLIIWSDLKDLSYYEQIDLFSDVTFENFEGRGITYLTSQAFGKSINTVKEFDCLACRLDEDSSTKITIFNINNLLIGFDDTKISSYAFAGSMCLARNLVLSQRNDKKEVTVHSKAFFNLGTLKTLEFQWFNGKFMKSAFYFNLESPDAPFNFKIIFSNCDLKGDSFENGTFYNLAPMSYSLTFRSSKIDYIPESSFKTVLQHDLSLLIFENSEFNYEDCRNYWLIRDYKHGQVLKKVKHLSNLVGFFEESIISKLDKCKFMLK